jgi:hypothetical protein
MPESKNKTVSDFEVIAKFVKKEIAQALDEQKKIDPAFKKRIKELFSLNADLEKLTSEVVLMVMDFSSDPRRVRHLIPAIMDVTDDIMTTKQNYEKAKHYPSLYFYNLSALENQFKDLKKLWNRKVWSLICEAKISTKVEKSFLSMLAETDVLGGLAI